MKPTKQIKATDVAEQAPTKSHTKKKFRRGGAKKDFVKDIKEKFGMNDVQWYLNYPELAKDVANIAQNFIPGTARFDSEFAISGNRGLAYATGLQIKTTLTPGMCTTASDPFNMAVKSIWLELHRKYRGIGTYESADLGIVIFCILAVFAMIAEGERAYGVCTQYAAGNRTIPNVYENLLNWNFTSLRADLANFRLQLNRLITKAQILCLPKGMPAFEDVTSLYSNLFKDREGRRAQITAFVQHNIWIFDPQSINTGSAAKAIHVNTAWNSTSYLLQLEAMIDALVLDDDVARICSDIIAMYESDLVRMGLVPEDYSVTPVYHEVRNLQIHNIRANSEMAPNGNNGIINTLAVAYPNTVTGVSVTYPLWVIQDGSNHVMFELYGVGSGSTLTYDANLSNTRMIPTTHYANGQGFSGSVVPQLFDIWKEQATPDDILELTRFSSLAVAVQIPESSTSYDIQTFRIVHGLYAVTEVNCITFEYNQGVTGYYTTWFRSAEKMSTSLDNVYAISAYDNAPLMFAVDDDGITVGGDSFVIYGAIDNLLFISESNLSEIHKICTLSEFTLNKNIIK